VSSQNKFSAGWFVLTVVLAFVLPSLGASAVETTLVVVALVALIYATVLGMDARDRLQSIERHVARIAEAVDPPKAVASSSVHFTLITADGDSLGPVELQRPDWPPGSIIYKPRGEPNLRIVDVIPNDDPEGFTILVVEPE